MPAMSNSRPENVRLEARKRALHTAARLFLEKGYDRASLREIAAVAGVNVNTMVHDFGCKENLLCELVTYVLAGQFTAAQELLAGITDDPILFYAAETTLQLYIVESAEHIRGLYNAAYSMSKTADIIRNTLTEKLERIFGAHLPHLTTKDFYRLEIASGGIMYSFMMRPCDAEFTMEEKVRAFLETSFKIYEVPEKKIQEAVAFVSRFDYPAIAQNTIGRMLAQLEHNMD